MKRALGEMWWLIGAGLLMVTAALFSPQVQTGDLSLSRSEPRAQLVLIALGVMGAVLLVGVGLAIKGSRNALLLCKIWGTLFGLVTLPLIFTLLPSNHWLYVLSMLAFAVVWYWGVSRIGRTGG